MTNTARAVLWDMDGTLIDSAEEHWLSWRDTLASEKYHLTREAFAACFGKRNDDILRTYLGPDLPNAEIDRIGLAKEIQFRALVRAHGARPLPGVLRWLHALNQQGWRQAVASSAPRANIDVALDSLLLSSLFSAVVSAEEVRASKPDPHVFLLAAERLDVPPSRCIVVEDAPAGIEAARRAGMRSIGVCTLHGALAADLPVNSLEELPESAFDDLL